MSICLLMKLSLVINLSCYKLIQFPLMYKANGHFYQRWHICGCNLCFIWPVLLTVLVSVIANFMNSFHMFLSRHLTWHESLPPDEYPAHTWVESMLPYTLLHAELDTMGTVTWRSCLDVEPPETISTAVFYPLCFRGFLDQQWEPPNICFTISMWAT